MLNHLVSQQERERFARKMAIWDIRLRMAKGLFWVVGALGIIIWVTRS